MASSSKKGGTWLSRFYHRQAGLVVLIVNLQGQSHFLYHLEFFFWVLRFNGPYFTTDAQVVRVSFLEAYL